MVMEPLRVHVCPSTATVSVHANVPVWAQVCDGLCVVPWAVPSP